MAGFQLTAWMNATPETIFRFITDVNHFSAIIPGVQSAEQITDGPFGLGTRFRETRLINGKPATTELEVTTYNPPHSYAATAVVSGVTTTYYYEFVPEKSGTRVNLQAQLTATGVRKLILPIVAGILKREDGEHLLQLKQAIESTASQSTIPS